MSGLETAIRNALERSDRANPEIRARIYQSARQALETGLRKQDVTDPETVGAQRQRLEQSIRSIEVEERMRVMEAAKPPEVATPPQSVPTPQSMATPQSVEPPQPPAPRHAPEAPLSAEPPRSERIDPAMSVRGETRDRLSVVSNAAHDSDLGEVRAGPADHLGAEGVVRDEPAGAPRSMDFKPERAVVRRKPRKIFSRLLVFCIVLAALGMGAWWVKTSGVLMTAAQRDTSVPNPPARVDADDYDGTDDDAAKDTAAPGKPASGAGTALATVDPQAGFSEEWVQVLKPTDGAKVSPGAQSKVETVAENDGPAIRVTSLSTGSDGDAGIEVPASVLQQIAGKPSTIAMTVQATTDTPSQITVECDFGSMGNCGRHRFDVTRQTTDILFQVRFDRSLVPNSAGRLVVNSDLDGKGAGVNIYAVRILPGQ